MSEFLTILRSSVFFLIVIIKIVRYVIIPQISGIYHNCKFIYDEIAISTIALKSPIRPIVRYNLFGFIATSSLTVIGLFSFFINKR